ncbi:NADPH-Fe(3+) oxidoreductase subunit beta [Andreesenia angusta]|uniref:NADPH-Fe(3+) oxidoreductase subunit beta n=1 Tax=Andreesenia angusta TaxID=39480 RepID=A0A1S1V9U7_9FIRM|nr:NAD(P)-binding protein [Andreesenia angusta]OHW63358.1 NADPH-Fe(3+) oxidoreductase subunit beta [Andreesenia angusta]
MSRLRIITKDRAQATVEDMYKDIERRIASSPPGLCPIDLSISFLKMAHAQTCGKCVPCRVGLGQLMELMESVLDGEASLETIDLIEKTARAIYNSSDCAIGYEAARMVLKGLEGFRDEYVEHILRGRCNFSLFQSVPCVSLCPAGVDVPGYIALIAKERYKDAVRLIRKDNPMPLVCGYVCEHPCETRCRRKMIDDSINIRGLKRYAVDNAGEVPIPAPAEYTGKRVAVVGGGPSGLSAAYFLSLMGHKVEIYESKSKLGGMLRYGIPSYRLPRNLLQGEIDIMLSNGVDIHTGVTVGHDISVMELREKFDSVYIAIGAHIDKKTGIEGEDAKGVYSAVDILRSIGDDIYPDFAGKKVLVLGGGNVAIDVARSAVRLGAEESSIIYRRRKDDMPAMEEEVEGAVAEGCALYDLIKPIKIETDGDENAVALWVQPQIVGTIESGRPCTSDAKEKPIRIPCDIIVIAIGQGIETRDFEKEGIPVKRGLIDALSTADVKDIPGVFAGGDCISGPATVIQAIAAGKVAAANIDSYLGFNHEIESGVVIPEPDLSDRVSTGRVNMSGRNVCDRIKDFELVEEPMTCKEAKQESERCLRCDHFGFGVFKGGRVERW